MTSTDRPVRGPAGMPAHLWELARSDVRLSVPARVRGAVANGLNAPDPIRRIAARVAVTGAALGVPAALIGLGGIPDTPVDLAGGEAPLDGFDGVPAVPGSSGGGDHGDHGGADHGGSVSSSTTGTGDVSAGLGSTWHVQDPSPEAGDWLTVQMFQDVTVTETADGMFVVDAWQYIVIRDDDGHEYVFKEHYQVIVPDPPGEETDLAIHEHGAVHVVENPDGSFAVVTTDYGIDVVVGADGDGRDEVGITQTQQVRVTDREGSGDDDVTVDLGEQAVSTSDDVGDEATTTIGQDQVFTDGDRPPSSVGSGPSPSGGSGSPTTTATSGAGGSAAARAVDPAPLASTLAAPVAVTTWPGNDRPEPSTPDPHPKDGAGGSDQHDPAPRFAADPHPAADDPFGAAPRSGDTGPFEPPDGPATGTPTDAPHDPAGSAEPSTPDDTGQSPHDPTSPGHGSAHEPAAGTAETPPGEHDTTGHGADHGTDGADPALV